MHEKANSFAVYIQIHADELTYDYMTQHMIIYSVPWHLCTKKKLELTVIHSVNIRFFAKHIGNCVVHGSQLCAFSKLISFQFDVMKLVIL